MATTEHKLVHTIDTSQPAQALESIRTDWHKVSEETKAARAAASGYSEAARQQEQIAKQAAAAEKAAAGESRKAQESAARAARGAAEAQEKAAREAQKAAAAQDRAAREAEMALQRVAAANQLVLTASQHRTASLVEQLGAERQGADAADALAAAREREARIAQASIDPHSRLAEMMRRDMIEQQRLQKEIDETVAARRRASAAAAGIASDRAEVENLERLVAARRRGTEALRQEEIAQQAAARAQQLSISLDSAEGQSLVELARRRAAANAALAAETAKTQQAAAGPLAGIGSRFAGEAAGMVAGALSIAAALGAVRSGINLAVESSEKFSDMETRIVGVAKTTGMARSEVEALYGEVRRLSSSTELPIATSELMDYAETAGQLGVTGRDGLLAYMRTLGMLSRTSDIVGQEGAEQLAMFINLTGELHSEAERTGSALTVLGNDASAGEKKILAMAQEIAAATTEFRLGAPTILGWSTALAELGREPEAASTSIATAIRAIQRAVLDGGTALDTFADAAGVSAEEFAAAWRRSPSEALEVLLRGISRFGNEGSVALDKLGLSSDRLDKTLPTLAQNMSLVAKRLEQGSVGYRENTALANEATQAFDTQASRLQALQNAVDAAKVSFGEGLAVGVERTTRALTDLSRQDEAIAFFRDLGEVVGELTAGLAKNVGLLADVIRQRRLLAGTADEKDIQALLDSSERRRKELEEIIAKAPTGASRLVTPPTVQLEALMAQAEMNRLVEEEKGLRVLLDAQKSANRAKDAERSAKEQSDASQRATEAAEEQKRQKALEQAAALRHANELKSVKEQEAAAKRLESQLSQLAAIEIKVKDTLAEAAALRRESAGYELPIKEQIELNRQLEIERRIREESKALRAILADPNAPGAARDEAAKRLKEIADAARELIAAEEGLATASTVADLKLREDAARRMAAAYLAGPAAINATRLALEQEEEARQTALATGNAEAALKQLQATRDREAQALANERIGTLDRQTAATNQRTATLAQGTAAAAAANRQDEFRARVLEQMEGVEEKYRAAIEARVRAQMRAEGVQPLVEQVAAMRDQLTLEIRVAGLSEMPAALRTVEENWLRFLADIGGGTVEAGAALFADMAKVLGKTVEELKAEFGQLQLTAAMDQQRGASTSRLELHRRELANERAIADARIAAGDDAVRVTADRTEKERQIRLDYWSGVLSDAQQVLGQLADTFGGFFRYLQQAANALQQAAGAYGSASSLASGLGASASASSTAGAFAAYLAIVSAAVDAFEAHAESRRRRQYDYAATLAFDSGSGEFLFSSNVTAATRDLARQIADTAEAFAAAIGGTISSLASLEITIRKDGEYYQARIGDTLLTSFRSYEEALSAAIVQAFADPSTSLRGLSDLVREGMDNLFSGMEFSTGTIGSEEALEHLTTLREIVELDWGQANRGMSEFVGNTDRYFDAVTRIGESSAAVVEAFDGIVASELGAWRAAQDAITGRQRTAAEELEIKKKEAVILNAQMQLRLANLRFEASLIEAERDHVRTNAELGRARLGLEGEILRGYGGGLSARQEIATQEIASLEAFLNAKSAGVATEAQLNGTLTQLMQDRLDAINNLIRGIEDLGPIDLGDIRLPGGGGRRRERESLEDRLRDILTSGLSETARDLAERRKQIRELQEEIARLGPNSELAAQALALLQDQLGESIRDRVRGSIAGGPSRTGLSEGRQAILDEYAEIEEAVRDHLEETGDRIVAFWEIRAARAAELARFVEEQIAGFGLPIEETRGVIEEHRERMEFLRTALEDGSISAERYADVTKQLSDQMKNEAMGLAQSLLETAGAGEQAAEVQRSIAQLQFEIDRRRLNMLHAELLATGELSDAEQARWNQLLAIINTFDPSTIELPGNNSTETPPPTGTSGGGVGATTDPLRDARAFLDRLAGLDRADRQGLNAERDRARETYAEMTEQARGMAWQFRLLGTDLGTVLGDIAKIFERTMQELTDQANEALRDAVQGLLFGPDSPIPLGQQIDVARAEYERLRQAAIGGDLDARQQLGGAFTQLYGLLTQQGGSLSGGAPELFQQFLAMMRNFGIAIPGLAGPSSFGGLPLPGAPANDTRLPIPFVREDLAAAQRGTEDRLDTLISAVRALDNRMYQAEQVQRDHGRSFADIATRLSRSAA